MSRLHLRTSSDIAAMQDAAREASSVSGLSPSAAMDVVVAATELGRNAITHGGGGTVDIEATAAGVRLCFTDRGPGIANLEEALEGGHSTIGTLGRGLSGARRLVDELRITTGCTGTCVTITKLAKRGSARRVSV